MTTSACARKRHAWLSSVRMGKSTQRSGDWVTNACLQQPQGARTHWLRRKLENFVVNPVWKLANLHAGSRLRYNRSYSWLTMFVLPYKATPHSTYNQLNYHNFKVKKSYSSRARDTSIQAMKHSNERMDSVKGCNQSPCGLFPFHRFLTLFRLSCPSGSSALNA